MAHVPKAAKQFTFIGSDDGSCPSCEVILERPPQKKAKCPHCGSFIFVRARPIDGERVLLKEADLKQLELEWGLDYKIKQETREPSPEWAKRTEEALASGPHPNERVERTAWEVFDKLAEPKYRSMAPRDAREALLITVAQDIRVEVEQRLWQLMVKSIHGA